MKTRNLSISHMTHLSYLGDPKLLLEGDEQAALAPLETAKNHPRVTIERRAGRAALKMRSFQGASRITAILLARK